MSAASSLGMAADLLVVDTFDVDPYRNLIEAVDPDVRLVVVDGRPIMGDVGLMTDLIGADEAEVVTAPGYQKAVDITQNGVPEGSQTFSSVLGELTSCMEGMSSSAAPKPLETWYTYGDERYFDVLNRSIPFQSGGRSIDLYGDYYAVEMDAAGDRTGVTLPSNLTSPETTIDGDDLVALAPTGGTLHPRLLSDATSIPMEACMDAPNASNQARYDRGMRGAPDPDRGSRGLHGGDLESQRWNTHREWPVVEHTGRLS